MQLNYNRIGFIEMDEFKEIVETYSMYRKGYLLKTSSNRIARDYDCD